MHTGASTKVDQMAQPDLNKTSSSNFHIAMFPWFAMGHAIPFLQLSNELAIRGHRISFLLPKKAQIQLQHLNLHPHLIAFCSVTVPHVEGLPEGTETASDIPTSLTPLLATAMDRTRQQIQGFLVSCGANDHKVDMIFYDFAYWVPEITRGLGIKCINYGVACAAITAMAIVPARHVPKDRPVTEEDLRDPPPGYPSSTVVMLPGREAQSLMFITMSYGDGITFYERLLTSKKGCDALCIRTCREVEGVFCDYLEAQYKRPVLLTGPVLGVMDSNNKNNKKSEQLEDIWANWFSGFEPESVVFVDLEATLKPPLGCATIEEALPQGFEERVKGRGVVFGGWVQQTLILSHPSVGCFVNHCGFGALWESLMSNNQIVLVPDGADHILNTKILVKDLKVAVEVEREENGWVSKESLSKAITTVMDKDNEVGVMVKKNQAKWRETLSTPGFMDGYIDRFVQKLKELVN
ncbi:UDP-glycosyltransferase 79B6-like [Prunus yedoensis var. nudiflora]|uniref:UDP-glycosyltransferase 79B6-like n=1 Tax=Prunus yedoensis var. nudiflora TaxID=2094558 RepID=A0A314UHX9_PRUYE|nr:UDP-glycosyltransferase 79B6-like [Prunus yedoensis var. nudiflora]